MPLLSKVGGGPVNHVMVMSHNWIFLSQIFLSNVQNWDDEQNVIHAFE